MKRLLILILAAVLGFGSLRAEVYSGSCGGSKSGTNIRWMLDTETGQLTLKGTGAMQNYMYITDPAPWFEVRMAIRHVTVTDGITSVGTWAFDQCFFLEDITLGKDISEVPMDFCGNNFRMHTIKVSKDNKHFSVKDGILYDKRRTVLLHFPAGHPAKEYTLPGSLEKIAAFAFSCNQNLQTLTIPSAKSIEGHAFSNCHSLKRINCHANVPPAIADRTVFDLRVDPVIYVPAKSMEQYEATPWKGMRLKPMK